VLCGLLLLGRVGDVVTTRLITPKLRLEANPIVRKLGWPFAVVSLGVCLIAYVHTGMAFAFLITSLLVTASNATKIWVARTLGEEAYERFMFEVARRSRPSTPILANLAVAGCFTLIGVLFMIAGSGNGWVWWGGFGVILYAFAIALYGTLFLRRLFRRVRAEEAAPAK
jgi:hypothetical protein